MSKNKRPPVSKARPSREIMWSDKKRIWCGLPWTFTRYSVSPDRLYIKRGLITIHEDEVRLYRIRDISLRQGFFQRLFGLGTINISSSDSSMGNFQLKNIKKSHGGSACRCVSSSAMERCTTRTTLISTILMIDDRLRVYLYLLISFPVRIIRIGAQRLQ